MTDPNLPYTIAVWLIPLVVAIVFHEVAHGYVARIFGDPTADRLGRLTLNPIRHVDPIGTVVLPMVLAIAHAPVLYLKRWRLWLSGSLVSFVCEVHVPVLKAVMVSQRPMGGRKGTRRTHVGKLRNDVFGLIMILETMPCAPLKDLFGESV